VNDAIATEVHDVQQYNNGILGQHLSIACFPSSIKHQTGVLLYNYNLYNVKKLNIKKLYKLHTVVQKSSSHFISSSETAIESLLSQYPVELAGDQVKSL